MIIPFCLALSFFVADQSNAIEKPVSDRTALQRALNHARPGDTIIMAARDWTDLRLKVTRSGEQGNPITIRAQERGKVRLVGNSKLDIHGSWVVVDGLTFTDGFPSSIPIVLRAGTTHCRITNCAIVDYNAVPAHPDPPTWVSVKGTHHRIDHCSFTGRRAKTALMRVASQENPEYHRIDHNYFGQFELIRINGAETIRIIATDSRRHAPSRTVVEYNMFEECDGEDAEIISNKSSENIFQGNTFMRSMGYLTLRKGDNSIVEGNFFLGYGKPKTRGVRALGKGHRVSNNYFEALSGRALTDPYGSCCQWGGNQIVEKPQAKRPTMTGEDGRVYRALRREDVGPFGPLGR